MLLRRITQHVKDQNWFAVGIDFFIVVAGVFVGMQVQSSYAEQERLTADSQYMERLHGEVEELIAIREDVVNPREQNYTALASASTKVFSTSFKSHLTIGECAAIQLSHVYLNPTVNLPTVQELLSAGRLDSLSSSPTRATIIRYTQSAARANDVIESINTGSLILTRKYPSLIKLDPTKKEDFGLILETPLAECNLPEMRTNQGFRNDLADNINRFDAYYLSTLVEPTNRLRELHDALDAELGLSHVQ